ncbi:MULTISPECIES: pPIWI_RE module domain-containing protein [unclassified Thermoactinomyces]|jgi:hypothetical protein|uniref:pPIWI_RE module domain-containing protein n=1 Tax=unclassified Thermoactinomyces TaxID=2634588 RepID=UPI00079FD7AC|nr:MULTISPECIES: DUF3962 domain-containing protein [unclassified Thermoactinomyces]KYQ87952.1 hypothetical protein AYX07_04580 [Thermoactinomyces sp. AS95]MBH8582425.1 DUF3962 domain-containing protein [Thermoactinomyces sp. CICC 10735]MBH8584782.1 DUF3962 domain-containing protein [Thermoactinomyces sp. CICC 10520]MBI0386406.1 DUF3962 domain-containing protein [Thermoactinomyces sp. CICC 24227]
MQSRSVLKELQPIAWDINEIPNFISKVYCLKLPDQWKDIINHLIQINREKDFVPTRSLQAALLAGAPEIIDFNYYAFKNNTTYWLISDQNFHTIDVNNLVSLIRQWIYFEFPGKQAHAFAQRLNTNGIKWEVVDVRTLPESMLKRILPQLIVRELIRREYRDPQNGRLFQIVPPLNTRQAAEIVSWEPSRMPENPDFSAHSYKLTFSVGRMLGKSSLQLFVDLGLRRWVGEPLLTDTVNHLPWKINQSVYLARQSISWLSDLPQESTFIQLQLRKESKDFVRWENRIPEFLNRINSADQNKIPDIKELLVNPQKFQPDVLIVYDQRMGISHPVGSGVTANDRKDFFESLNNALYSIFNFSPSSKWIRQRTLRQQKLLTDSKQPINQKAVIEIWSNDADRWEELIKEEINDDQNKDKLQIVKREPHPITNLLDFDPEDPNQQLKNAIQYRIDTISKLFEKPKNRTGILIEMPNYNKMFVRTKDANRDPKSSVRYGLAITGRLTQFITPEYAEPKSYEERIKMAINDLLRRQMQWKRNTLYTGYKKTSLPKQLDLLAFWVINKRRKRGNLTIPLVGYAPSNDTQIKVCLPGENGNEWQYYSEALLKITQIQTNFDGEGIHEFFKQAIEELDIKNPALLLLDERNLRKYWPKLNNEELIFDDQNYKIYDDFLHHSELRIVKLRFSEEKPLSIPIASPTREVSKYQGLFAPENGPDNVFYSFQEKPVTAEKIKTGLRHRDAMHKHYWNSVTAEIILLNLKKGDNPAEWAFVVHSLRKSSEHIDSATRLPEPLYSLKCMEEYVIPEELL